MWISGPRSLVCWRGMWYPLGDFSVYLCLASSDSLSSITFRERGVHSSQCFVRLGDMLRAIATAASATMREDAVRFAISFAAQATRP